MECSPRGGGNRLAEMLRYSTGVDLITNSVRAAIGEPCIGIEQKPYSGAWVEVILHSDKVGVFEDLWISEAIKKNIIETDLWINKGARVGDFSGANEAIGTLVLKFDTQLQVDNFFKEQNSLVSVKVNDFPTR